MRCAQCAQARYAKIRVGDTLVLYSGQRWCVWCKVTSCTRVVGTDGLFQQFLWQSLMPEHANDVACKHAYEQLIGCNSLSGMIVWGVQPTHVKLFDHAGTRKVTWDERARQMASNHLQNDGLCTGES
jgi:hypothetical protein